jgi:hypothetical protein
MCHTVPYDLPLYSLRYKKYRAAFCGAFCVQSVQNVLHLAKVTYCATVLMRTKEFQRLQFEYVLNICNMYTYIHIYMAS